MQILLQTDRLILRQFTADDANNLFELDRDPAVMRYVNGGVPTEYAVICDRVLPRFLAYHQNREPFGFWAVVEQATNQFIGWLHLIPALDHAFAAELGIVRKSEIAIGYRFCRSTWGKGYATEGSRALMAKGFQDWGVERIVAWALTVNHASIRVMEKVGLQFEREFAFRADQLPNVLPAERRAVKYGCHNFYLSSGAMLGGNR